MNPFITKIISFGSKITKSGLVKPLPLSGIAKEFTELKESKNKIKGVLRFSAYLISGLIIYAVLFKGFPVDKALELLSAFGF